MAYVEITDFDDYIAYINNLGSFDISRFRDKIAIIEVKGRPDIVNVQTIPSSKLEALALIMVEKGEVTMNIDYRSFCIGENMAVILSDRHFIQFVSVSDDFRCCIVFSVLDFVRNTVNDMQSFLMPDMFTSLMNNPVVRLEKEEFAVLRGNLERLRSVFCRKEHAFLLELALHEMAILTIEMSNILHSHYAKEPKKQKISNRENVIARFLKLLFEHSRTEREVAFYADKLNVTSVYLLRAVKHVIGKSAIKVILEMAVSDAMALLRKPEMTIQDVAGIMNFADRITFSKFFKKNSGMSPGEYRKKITN